MSLLGVVHRFQETPEKYNNKLLPDIIVKNVIFVGINDLLMVCHIFTVIFYPLFYPK